MVVSHHVVAGELNSEPLEEQSVLLTAEPSLPSCLCLLSTWIKDLPASSPAWHCSVSCS
ncbi:rCG31059, isoform CRA_b [Rattus norvegicus]|uniref:RCG31059, isoform CRA_b n=1 Tax=Rattus norvegicus TaxID=10116 RepID=A6IUW0_RAT|nr:rCG31059, isoform CRA_b [Rattus norvegicus]